MPPTRTPPRPEVVQVFEQRQWQGPHGSISYRLYRPRAVDPTDKVPLLVWFHGRGEAGENNRDQLAWLELILGRRPSDQRGPRCEILALQCPVEQPTWGAAGMRRPDPLDTVSDVLYAILAEEPIDEDRIYLSGVSSGGTACWEFARRHPGRFAAIVPFATTSADSRVVSALRNTPVWAFQSSGDGPGVVQATNRLVTALVRCGGRARLTIVKAAGHDCWTEGFQRHRAWPWMLAQRRGDSWAWPPGWPPPRNSLLGFVLSVSSVSMGLAWAILRRRRGRRKRSGAARLFG